PLTHAPQGERRNSEIAIDHSVVAHAAQDPQKGLKGPGRLTRRPGLNESSDQHGGQVGRGLQLEGGNLLENVPDLPAGCRGSVRRIVEAKNLITELREGNRTDTHWRHLLSSVWGESRKERCIHSTHRPNVSQSVYSDQPTGKPAAPGL